MVVFVKLVLFCYALLYGEERELVALLSLPSWCLVMVGWLFLAVPWVCLRFVIVVFPDHTHYFCLFLAALLSPAGKGLNSWLSCVLRCLVFLSLSHMVSRVRCDT